MASPRYPGFNLKLIPCFRCFMRVGDCSRKKTLSEFQGITRANFTVTMLTFFRILKHINKCQFSYHDCLPRDVIEILLILFSKVNIQLNFGDYNSSVPRQVLIYTWLSNTLRIKQSDYRSSNVYCALNVWFPNVASSYPNYDLRPS